ncbi:GNAT family N-acetyltransferase [Alicyclobacillus suci]|uniref:GNAT family N-acetyltransferase n=1 Tax=Alicyclobacillus suci TaxID=2816080 RepID=UPI001A8D15F1|nr:GNAT family protein [Alicyclobacillus suci]
MSDLFKGNRIRLTALQEADAEAYARWSEDGEYLRNLDTDYAVPRTAAFFRENIQHNSSNPNVVEFGIRLLDKEALIGFVAVHSIEWNNHAGRLAIGIGDSAHRGQGLGTEALKLVLRYAFHELNLNRVGLDVIANNEAAIRSYEKAGFVIEGTVRDAVLRDGQAHDRIYMGILRRDWQSRS